MQNKDLYRGKRKDMGEWIYGTPIQRADRTEYIIISTIGAILKSEINNMTATAFVVIPGTVGQYTGMNDKNGRKIFEGDIVRFQRDSDSCPFPNPDTKKRIGRVYFNDFRASYAIAMGHGGSPAINYDLHSYIYRLYELVRYDNRVEILGNTADNPEFLRGGESEET